MNPNGGALMWTVIAWILVLSFIANILWFAFASRGGRLK